MDPITQGALGASVPQSLGKPERMATITWLGCLAGMAPDLDVLIQSPSDPILFLEFHRQFTHSLFFIPIGALICATVFYRWSRAHFSFKQTYIVCCLAYGTHALLDACTTYGTQLLWPFTDARFAWNNVSVIDPLATVPLLIMVILSWRKSRPLFAQLGLLWFLGYLGLGVFQKDRATEAGQAIAESRGHHGVVVSAKPGFANILLWKVIYEYQDTYYVDAVRAGLTPTVYEGDRIKKLNLERDLPWLNLASQQALDVTRFDWFSAGYLALDPHDPMFVIDMRYSVLPNQIKPLWGIRLNPNAGDNDHVEFISERDTSAGTLQTLYSMILGK